MSNSLCSISAFNSMLFSSSVLPDCIVMHSFLFINFHAQYYVFENALAGTRNVLEIFYNKLAIKDCNAYIHYTF